MEIPVEGPSIIDLEKLKEAFLKNELEAVICGGFGLGRDLPTMTLPTMRIALNTYRPALRSAKEGVGAKFLGGPML